MSHNRGHGGDVDVADDLTRIAGIGSKTAEKLNMAGIRSYADLASRSADDIAKLLPDVTGLSAARIDSWRGQAQELAATTSATAVGSPEIQAGEPDDGQHYESFMIRVLINKDGSIRRTTAQHIRTGAQHHWRGLEREALPDFIETTIASATPSAKTSTEPPPDQARQAEAAVTRPGVPQP